MQLAIQKNNNVYQLGVLATVGAILAICIIVLFGFRRLALPVPATMNAPAENFSAGRAAITVGQMATKPHAIGTSENARVRTYLIDSLHALGLEPEVQSGVSVSQDYHSAGMVHNIVVRLPGKKPGKALLLVAHYDSVPISPGAADDGASVAAILETLRALKSGSALNNDVVCLLTDGEEVGLLGARLFMQEHPLAKNIGIVINFEYRGNSGPIWMFETGAGNERVIEGFAKSVARPLGNSLLSAAYKFMPNDTDLTIFKRAGVPALNFAAGEGYTSYHTQLDRADALNQGTLQQAGDIMLSLTRYFGNAEIGNLAAPDSVYSDIPLFGMVSYSERWLLPIFLLSLVLLITVGVAARKHLEIRIGHTLASVPIYLVSTALLVFACQLIWNAMLQLYPDYQLILHHTPYNSDWYLLFFVAFSVGAFALFQRLMARWLRPIELACAAMLVWVVALGCISFVLPGASFVLAWPLIPMLMALNVLLIGMARKASAAVKLSVLLVGAAPGLLLLPPIIALIYNALTPNVLWAAMLVLVLFLGIVTPLFDVLSERLSVRIVPFLMALICFVGAEMHSRFDAQHPRPDNLSYVQPQQGGQALWASTDTRLDTWTKPFFSAETERRNESSVFGQTAPLQWLGKAPSLGVDVPRLTVIDDQIKDATRLITLSISSQRLAPKMSISIDGIKVIKARVQGKLYSREPNDKWQIETYGMQEEPIRLELEVPPGNSFRAWVRDYTYGLPPSLIKPRPAEMMIQPFQNSDTIQAVSSTLIQ